MEGGAFHIAQVNVARPRAPVDSPLLADFKALLDPVNAVADAAPGFVWRLQDDSGNATSIAVPGDESLLVNMSVWESIDALWDFVYGGEHLDVMRRRREWFEGMELYMCLWWVRAGHRPTVDEAAERLGLLRLYGPTPRAFTFKQRFDPVPRPPTGRPIAGH
jgi:Domain of unknown function (DUF3291)